MGLLDDIARVRAHLEQNGSVSYRVLKREFGLDDEGLEDIVDELVDMQQVAIREEKGLSWRTDSSAARQAPAHWHDNRWHKRRWPTGPDGEGEGGRENPGEGRASSEAKAEAEAEAETHSGRGARGHERSTSTPDLGKDEG